MMHVTRSITVNRPRQEIFQFWRHFENLPLFMEHLAQVEVNGDKRSHWVARAPAGADVEWDAEITDEFPNEFISWRSLAGSDVENTGSVRFRDAPADRGTEIEVDLLYEPPAGRIGAGIARLFGEEPGQQVRDDLRRLKQVLETGEVMR